MLFSIFLKIYYGECPRNCALVFCILKYHICCYFKMVQTVNVSLQFLVVISTLLCYMIVNSHFTYIYTIPPSHALTQISDQNGNYFALRKM